MNVVKNSLNGIVWLLLVACSAPAQSQRGSDMSPEDRAQKQTEMMTEALNLTEAQVAQVEEINLRYSQKTEEIRNGRGSRRDKFGKARQLIEEKDAELKRLFTVGQYTKYEDLKAEMRKKVKEGRSGQ